MSRGRDAHSNRLEALRKLRDARGRAIKIHHSTGRALAEDRLATKTKRGLWLPTDAGVAYIDRTERAEKMELTRRKCRGDEANRERHQKVMAWLGVHARLTAAAALYVEHVVDALLAGERVVESGYAWDGGDALCRAWAETALDSIELLEEAQAQAHAEGGDLTVAYGTGEKVVVRSGQRRARVVRALAEDNLVSIEDWKEARA